MNLRAIANGMIQGINPNIQAILRLEDVMEIMGAVATGDVVETFDKIETPRIVKPIQNRHIELIRFANTFFSLRVFLHCWMVSVLS